MKKQNQIKPNLELVDGKINTTSLDVARNFKKRHGNVLRDIEKLECSQSFRRLNFESSSYQNEQNKRQIMYRISRDGFAILVMGYTGQKAMQWKEKYIAAFNRMEDELKKQWLNAKLQASKVRLSDWAAINEIMKNAGNGKNTFSKLLNNFGFTKDGPIPNLYTQIPPSKIVSFVKLARTGNAWARNLIHRTQKIDVPVAITQV